MARQVRIEYARAVGHVMCRGDHQEAIFRDDLDQDRFLETLEKACGMTGRRIHGYVLMGNHYHLPLETKIPDIVLLLAGIPIVVDEARPPMFQVHNEHPHIVHGALAVRSLFGPVPR